ncbi:MAG: hypothetical protein WBM32_11200 [Crocosphaera sp.]|jgi:hypothetical protein
MNRIFYSLIPKTLLILSVFALTGQSTKIMAQNDSQEFFEQGEQQMEQDTQMLEQQQEQPTLEQRERQLEQELNINAENEKNSVEEGINGQIDRVSPSVENIPGADETLGLDDNLPYQPDDEEVQIKF